MRHRPGFSLSEVLVALTLVTLAATLTADVLLRAMLRAREAGRRVEQLDDARHLAAILLHGPCGSAPPAVTTRHPLQVTARDSATLHLTRIVFEGPSPPAPLTLERGCD
jgi:prepilin-type N-terminal cleavage/methylation domain-containing protein